MSRSASLALNLAFTIGLALLPGFALADLTQTDGHIALQASTVATPARGSSMSQVEAQYGAPQSKHAAVGKPPITRWDYANFSVYFENSRVLHAVAH
jgi:hypothetical protein